MPPSTKPKSNGPAPQPPPIEIYGLGTVQRLRDDVYHLEQCVEKSVHAHHRLEDETNSLTDAIECLTSVAEEIRDELKKMRDLLEAKNDA